MQIKICSISNCPVLCITLNQNYVNVSSEYNFLYAVSYCSEKASNSFICNFNKIRKEREKTETSQKMIVVHNHTGNKIVIFWRTHKYRWWFKLLCCQFISGIENKKQRLLGMVELGHSLMRPFNNPQLEVPTFRDLMLKLLSGTTSDVILK